MQDIKIGISYNTSEHDLEEDFYRPCLQWASNYDRGVGFFTSGWISRNAIGLSDFVSRGGHIRWIISPILSYEDYQIIMDKEGDEDKVTYFRQLLIKGVEQLRQEMEEDTKNAFAWMIYDGVLEIKFAVPYIELEDGDFHDKFGIFSDGRGNSISFLGSINDTQKGFSNYESIKVFKSWVSGVSEYVESDVRRFERLWNNYDNNVKIFDLEAAISNKIFKLRTSNCPYVLKKEKNLWKHQEDAVNTFFKEKHGILAMATGTGKTRTALQIMKRLFKEGDINRCIIIVDGNDLLNQWFKEIQNLIKDIHIFRYYGSNREYTDFLLWRKPGILLLSREPMWVRECLEKLESRKREENVRMTTLLLFDEVHGMGSYMLQKELMGVIRNYKYRLGLSATPEREYDEVGNQFIEEEIGSIIYEFGLEKAIERGILCEFGYEPIEFELLDSERREKRNIIARYEYKKKNKVPFDIEVMYRELANINKVSEAKLPLFKEFVKQRPEILERSIIFVENKEYGEKVQGILSAFIPDYHTYYSEDRPENLIKFANGELRCLVTCKKISEGVDIKSARNIILFSSDRGKLVVTQRIGRSLRLNPSEPNKRAMVVDFICRNSQGNIEKGDADQERRIWLSELAKCRRNDNETV
ncbi:MAG: DEAD/DEAH box helicase family protein [Tissierellaceae bacterium]|nr:DEAD/DEAH box helicase family protein [Tissierellaceae bacterium]